MTWENLFAKLGKQQVRNMHGPVCIVMPDGSTKELTLKYDDHIKPHFEIKEGDSK